MRGSEERMQGRGGRRVVGGTTERLPVGGTRAVYALSAFAPPSAPASRRGHTSRPGFFHALRGAEDPSPASSLNKRARANTYRAPSWGTGVQAHLKGLRLRLVWGCGTPKSLWDMTGYETTWDPCPLVYPPRPTYPPIHPSTHLLFLVYPEQCARHCGCKIN